MSFFCRKEMICRAGPTPQSRPLPCHPDRNRHSFDFYMGTFSLGGAKDVHCVCGRTTLHTVRTR